MSNAPTIHQQAMNLLWEARMAFENGDTGQHSTLTRRAFLLEKEAAMQLQWKPDAEPSRSVLHRSAAQLAYDIGEFAEAEQLIAQALLGYPPAEIRQELRDLNRKVGYSLEVLQEITWHGDPYYLESLRANSLHIRVKPKQPTHQAAVYVDTVLDVLKRLKDSFLSYLEIDFLKKFDIENAGKVIGQLKQEANPLIADLRFSSFAASISSDLVVMTKSHYSDEIKTWKRDLFQRYKTDIFEPDYESEQAIGQLTADYTDKEKRLIFQPIVELFRETNSYQFTLTDSKFLEPRRTFKPISKSVRKILIPELTDQEIKRERVLFQMLSMGEPDGGGRISQSDVITRQILEAADWTWPLHDIRFEKEILFLKEELYLNIRYQRPVFQLSFSPLLLEMQADEFPQLIKDFQRQVLIVYQSVFSKKPAELTADEQSMKIWFDANVSMKTA